MVRLKKYGNWPVKNKLSLIVLVTSGLLIAVMLTGVTIEKVFSYRAKSQNHSMILAEIIGENSTAALSFSDKVTAQEILSALKAESDVLEVALYSSDESLFARFVHKGYWSNDSSLWFAKEYTPSELKPAIGFNAPWFTTQKSIRLEGKVIGRIVLRIDLTTLNTQLYYFVISMTVFSMVLLAIATAACLKLNQAILDPVIQLAETMQHVSTTGRYDVNAAKRYDDEIGVLVDGFNSMLEGIAKRDDELAAYRNDLQNLVSLRTEELEVANSQLKHEIEERQEMQKKLVHAEKMEAIGTLAGGVAHDLNNILSGVVTYPDLLLMQLPPDSNFIEPLETIRDSGRRAAAIVQDLLTLARRGVKVEEVFEFQELIDQYLRSLEFRELQNEHPNVSVNFAMKEDTFYIKGSPVHISKTVMNLVSNAMEAIRSRGEVDIELEKVILDTQPVNFVKWRAGEYIQVTVRDTGVGIDADSLDRIYEPFFSHKVMGKSGTGLGMSVVWGTVEDHEGTIMLTSSPGIGTTFTLLFPSVPEPKKQIRKQVTEPSTGVGEIILVVDDSKEQRLIAADILRHLEYRVVTLPSGEEAVEFLKGNDVDLIILDMLMEPGLSGIETYKKITEFKAEQKAIIASGYSQTASIEEAHGLGISDFIVKPYSVERLSESLQKVLAG
ncbi:response regulator [Desulforhopalus sp. 52FAK]